MEQNNLKPTEAELEILQILWANGACSVKFVHELIQSKREVGYTTTLKTMQVMHDKGLLTRERGFWKSHDYAAAVSQSDVQARMLDQIVQTAFGGSMQQLLLSALGQHGEKVQDLEEIKAFIAKMEENK
jgi:BlaI family transcriptional regulator, penicillinase repressor